MAAGVFLLLPLTLLFTAHTKTEPLAILSTCGAVYGVVRAGTGPDRRYRSLLLSGLCVGAAFYIRQSTLAVLPALLLMIGLERRWEWKETLRSTAVLLLGTASVTAIVYTYYLRALPLSEILMGGVSNPVSFVVGNLQGLLGALAGSEQSAADTFARSDQLSLERSLGNFSLAAMTTLVLAVGVLLAVLPFAAGGGDEESGGDRLWRYAVPVLWIGCIGLAYGFWTVKRGFYPAYFLEWTPPMALLTGATVQACWRHLPGGRSARKTWPP